MNPIARQNMQITAVQSLVTGTGVSLTARELIKQAKRRGKRVLAVDLCTKLDLAGYLGGEGFVWLDDSYKLFGDPSKASWIDRRDLASGLALPDQACLYDPDAQLQTKKARGEKPYSRPLPKDRNKASRMLSANFDLLDSDYDICVIDVPGGNIELMQLTYGIVDQLFLITQEHAGPASNYSHYQDAIISKSVRDKEPHIVVLGDRVDRIRELHPHRLEPAFGTYGDA